MMRKEEKQSIREGTKLQNQELSLLSDDCEEGFRKAFADKDVDAAYRILDQIFAAGNASGKAESNIAIVKIRTYETFNLVMDIFREYVSDAARQEIAVGYLNPLIKVQTVEEISGYFKKLVQFQIQTIAGTQIWENKGCVAQVVKYVEKHYNDYNLNISTMAEVLRYNPRYISRVFKEETQMGILEYISSVRINKAKAVMAEQKYTLEELAGRVGYTNERSFRRAFVKITGETPSVYMENES